MADPKTARASEDIFLDGLEDLNFSDGVCPKETMLVLMARRLGRIEELLEDLVKWCGGPWEEGGG